MAFDLKTAVPVVQKSDGSYEPVETLELATAKPIAIGEIPENIPKSITVYLSTQTKQAAVMGLDAVMNMPILGGFSPNQIDDAMGLAAIVGSEERSQAFKWAALGMPTDLEGIKKAETMRWAQIGYESPIIDDVRSAIGEASDIGLQTVGENISPLLKNIKIPEGINRETIKNFPIEITGDLLEFFSDPAALLTAEAAGYVFKAVPSILKSLEYNHPDFHKLITTDLKLNSTALKNAYKTLGLNPNSSATQINKAYRSKIIDTHPDRGGDVELSKQIQNAYDIIQKSRDTILRQIQRMYKNSKIGSTRGSVGIPKEPSGGKERGFVSSIKEEMPNVKVAGQYIPRSTDKLAIKARNLIKDDVKTAENQAMKGTDDASISIGAELLKYYSEEAGKVASDTAKDALYEKAAELGNSMAKRLTDLGRSVQAASILSRLTPEGQVKFAAKTIQKFNEDVAQTQGGMFGLRKAIPELTPEQVKDIISRMQDIQNMPEGEQKAIMFQELQNDISDLVPTPLMRKIVTVWKAGLLTGLKTTGVNILANASSVATEALKDIPATMVDMLASTFTGKRSVAFTTKGLLKGGKEGAQKGWRFLKTGYDERNALDRFDYKRVNMGKSKLAKGLQKYEEFIFRVLGAEDQPFYYGAKMRSLYEQAKVEAINKGLNGNNAKAFIDNLVMNPTDDMVLRAVSDAKIAVFQNETMLGNVARKFQGMGDIAEFVLPFGKTPSAVATQIINYTPVGAMLTILNNIGAGKFNQYNFSKGMGRGVTGTAVLGLGAYLFNQGLLNLDRPTTESEQKEWELEGRTPNTIKIGGKYRQLQTLGQLGNVLLIGGHFAKAYKDTGTTTGAMAQGAFGAIKTFTEQTFLQGVNQVMDAITDPKRSAMSFINSFAASFIPTIASDLAKGTDAKVRRAQTMSEKIIERIPILRQILEPKIDVFGRDIKRTENFLETMADPTRLSTVKNDPVANEIRRLKDGGNEIELTQLGKKGGYSSLTPKENTQLWREAGQMALDKIQQLMDDPNYEVIPDDVKARRINKFISDAKDNARVSIAIQKTEGMDKREDLKKTLSAMVEDGLLTRELYDKYLRLR
jgi:hypothetical protein